MASSFLTVKHNRRHEQGEEKFLDFGKNGRAANARLRGDVLKTGTLQHYFVEQTKV